MSEDAVRIRAYLLSVGPEAGTAEDNWLRAERELTVVHDYDTVDRDLERAKMTVSRIPLEAGVLWRLQLPRGEQIEAWEPGNNGLAPPEEIAALIRGVAAGKELVPAPPVSEDPGAQRLREMLLEQRRALIDHDPGVRLGADPENLHEHRVAARRARAFLRACRGYVDAEWGRTVAAPLGALGELTGPVRDLDVLLEHVRGELDGLDGAEREGGYGLVGRLEAVRAEARQALLHGLDTDVHRALLARLHAPPRLAKNVREVPLDRIAAKEFRRLTRAVGRLGRKPDGDAIHALRIKLKRARYAAELFAPKGNRGVRFLDAAKALQTLLGEHQDAVVAEERLRAAAVTDDSTAAAFVAGRIAERQRRRRDRVTERLPAAWKRLRKSGG
ncbi:MAG TPA: CHAD domain-containing protein [Gaiellaceae bacterium]|nr:CHAD domain-containing protein [Gaiellaceae bacterium]